MQKSALLLKKKLLGVVCQVLPKIEQSKSTCWTDVNIITHSFFSNCFDMLICIKQFWTAYDTQCGICWAMYMMTFVDSVGQYWLVYHWLLLWLQDVLYCSYFLVMCRHQILCQHLLVWQFICIVVYHSTNFTMEPWPNQLPNIKVFSNTKTTTFPFVGWN